MVAPEAIYAQLFSTHADAGEDFLPVHNKLVFVATFEDVLLFFSTEQSMWLSNNLSNGLQVATSGHASILELFTLVEHVYILR